METARLSFGLAAAVVVPLGAGWHRSRAGLTVLFSLGYGLYAIAPYRDEGRPWGALAAAALLAGSVALWHRSADAGGVGLTLTLPLSTGNLPLSRRLGAAAFGAAVLLSSWVAGATTASLGADLLLSDRAAVVLSALLIAVFGGGVLAAVATGPVVREIESLPAGPERDAATEFMNSGGRAIGLLERGLLFAFLAAGQPEAAALVLAAKSLARVPAADHGTHASEYFLIGTLASVIAALTMSMAARAVMGLPVL
ncbi:hypothetical protein [Streptomyces sp. NPDC050856]|uniref:hypothetical protein n=1 Tax=Streptomyces sp. NPDC050856 TaxID=3154939 RepID=UPI003410254C